MVEDRQLRCLIATGGTVGHVAPSLAVAEARRARGVDVTFAGSPDRVEARLVPERGDASDGLAIAGFPRRAGPGLARALRLALAAPFACWQILARRRPDVVLGGGGYVGARMVFAAWLRRIPAALTEADAHVGLANRLARPFVRGLFLAYPIEGANGKTRVVGRPIPIQSRSIGQAEARRTFELPEEGPVVLVSGGSLGSRTLNEMAIEAWGAEGPAVLHLSGERDYDELRGRVSRSDYRLFPLVDELVALAAAHREAHLDRRDRRRRHERVRARRARLGRGGRRLGPRRDAVSRPPQGDLRDNRGRALAAAEWLGGLRLDCVRGLGRGPPPGRSAC